jgi:adenosylhomocysteine nucleosidase
MTGVIGAMKQEVDLLRASLENPIVSKFGAFEFFSGKLEGKDIVLLQCGIGKVRLF